MSGIQIAGLQRPRLIGALRTTPVRRVGDCRHPPAGPTVLRRLQGAGQHTTDIEQAEQHPEPTQATKESIEQGMKGRYFAHGVFPCSAASMASIAASPPSMVS